MDDTIDDGPTAAAAGRATSKSFKVVLLGEGCVGKTSLVLRYTEDKFNDKHVSTLQVGAYLTYLGCGGQCRKITVLISF